MIYVPLRFALPSTLLTSNFAFLRAIKERYSASMPMNQCSKAAPAWLVAHVLRRRRVPCKHLVTSSITVNFLTRTCQQQVVVFRNWYTQIKINVAKLGVATVQMHTNATLIVPIVTTIIPISCVRQSMELGVLEEGELDNFIVT